MGIDGCSYGYLGILIDKDKNLKVFLSKNIGKIFNHFSFQGKIFIDMPMGFEEEKGVRTCDQLARKFLGFPRSASIFNTPVRKALHCLSYPEANEINKDLSGKGLSKQSFYLFEKMRDLDTYIRENPNLCEQIHESHPEMLFKTLKGGNLQYSKRVKVGYLERLAILSKYILDIDTIVKDIIGQLEGYPVKKDDILDSLVLVFGAYLSEKIGQIKLPEEIEYDSYHLPMAIYCIKGDSVSKLKKLSFNNIEFVGNVS